MERHQPLRYHAKHFQGLEWSAQCKMSSTRPLSFSSRLGGLSSNFNLCQRVNQAYSLSQKAPAISPTYLSVTQKRTTTQQANAHQPEANPTGARRKQQSREQNRNRTRLGRANRCLKNLNLQERASWWTVEERIMGDDVVCQRSPLAKRQHIHTKLLPVEKG